jgi:DNA-binding transcriptional MocR family regulator
VQIWPLFGQLHSEQYEDRVDDYRLLADALEAEMRTGALRPGVRLMPQRQFAQSRGIAASTAARVYQELTRRGLVSGEVGRGTYVLDGAARPAAVPMPERSALIDLEANFPVLAEQPAMLAAALRPLLDPKVLGATLHPVGVRGGSADRHAMAGFLSRGGWTPDPATVLFTGSGRQAIAAAIAGLVPKGQRLGVEELTYPVVKSVAAHLGVTLVPMGMDGHGVIPAEIARVHAEAPLRAVYLQPSLHNPLGVTMSPRRRADIARTLRELDLVGVEDGVNCFLRDDPPLASYAAERTVYVDSLSKRIAAGVNLGFLVAPPDLVDDMASAIRSGTWAATGFALAAARALIGSGVAARIVSAKRADAATRQKIVLERLADFDVTGDPASYHSWWLLPRSWHAETFVSAAARNGISISPAAAFAVSTGRVPNAVRLSNSSPGIATLERALDVLVRLAGRAPEDAGFTY